MTEHRHTLRCQECGGWVAFRAPRCFHCGAKQSWTWTVELARGPTVHSLAFERDALPGLEGTGTEHAQGPAGATLRMPPLATCVGTLPSKLVNACVAAVGVARGSETTMGVVARSVTEGGDVTGYAAEVWPAKKQLRLVRWLRHEGGAILEPVHDWKHVRAIGGEGERNEIELRVGSTRLEVLVQRERTVAVDDNFFGYGRCGWMARTDRAAGEVTFSSLDVFVLG